MPHRSRARPRRPQRPDLSPLGGQTRALPHPILLGLGPPLAVLALGAAFPTIVGHLTGGRDVNWVTAAYSWPALIILVAAALVAAAATLIARSWQLSQTRRNLADVPGRPASAGSSLPVSSQKPALRSHP